MLKIKLQPQEREAVISYTPSSPCQAFPKRAIILFPWHQAGCSSCRCGFMELCREPSEGPWEDVMIKPWQRGCDSSQHPGLAAGLRWALPAPSIIHLRLVTQNGPVCLNPHRIRASFSEETKSSKGLWATNSTDHLS